MRRGRLLALGLTGLGVAGLGGGVLSLASCDGARGAWDDSADRGRSAPGTGPASADPRAILGDLRAAHPALFARPTATLAAVGPAVEASCDDGCVARVAVAPRADQPTTVIDDRSGVGARFRLAGARPVDATLDRDLAVYPAALPGGDVVVRAGRHGVEDFVRFAEQPAVEELRYVVAPIAGAALRQIGDVLEILDVRGVPRIRIEAPWLVDSEGRRHAASLEVEGCAVDRDPRAPWSRPRTELDAAECTVIVDWSDTDAVYPVLVDPAWTEAGNMIDARTHHTATLLPEVGILLAGGFDEAGTALASAEIGCPAEICGFPVYTVTDAMDVARGAHGEAALDGERVLLTGGRNGRSGAPLASAEVYDASSGEFTATIPMAQARDGHTTTRIEPDGDVLVAGGDGLSPSTAERFDAGDLAFAAPIAMSERRTSHAAEALDEEGMVLIVGGLGAGGFPLQSAEVFDAAAGTFTAVADTMTAPRAFATATRLDDGRVLVTGGTNGAGVYYSTADIFEPDGAGGGEFQQQPVIMERPRAHHRATKLLGTPGVPGRVLLTGGYDGTQVLQASEVFDAEEIAFELASTMIRARDFHTATRLPSGQVLVTGGGFDLVTTDVESARSTEILLRDLGEPCAAGAECESGFCPGAPSGVCCDQACEETCETCLTGTCFVVPDDTTVKPVCTDDVEILLVCQDGEVSAGAIDPCSPFACDGDACGTSCDGDAQCSADGWCNDTVCAAKKPVGEGCTEDRECDLGFCADGVCCNARCDGKCEACDLGDAVGVCRQNAGPPRPGRGTCEGAGGPCEGVCGSDPEECDYEPIACSEGLCADGQLTVGRCHVEERGVCTEQSETCGAFACNPDGDACSAACSSVDDCAPGHACRPDGQCILVEQAECDGDVVVSPDGTTRDCAPYTCREAACLERCTSVDDCTAPSVCDESGACVAPPADPPPPDGCAVGGGDGRGSWTLVALAALGLIAARRRSEVRS